MRLSLRNPWLKLALALSLAMNLLVLGAVGGVVLHRGEAGRGLPGLPGLHDPGLFGYVAMLPREARAALREEGRALRAEVGVQDRRAEIRARNAALAAQIAAPDLDPDALRAAFEDLAEARGEAEAALRAALIQRILALPADERAHYAERILRGRGGPDGTRSSGSREGPPPR
jgi:uncharacterized membrane protein